MDKQNKEKIKRIIDETEGSLIVINQDAIVMAGRSAELLALTTMIMKHLHEDFNIKREQLEETLELSLMSKNEIVDKTIEKLKKIFK